MKIDRHSWPNISTQIAIGFEKDARLWFDHIVREFEQAAKSADAAALQGRHVSRVDLSGDGEISIKAFQLIVASRILNTQKYVPESDAKDFADLLWAQVCGARLDDVIDRVHFYEDATNNEDEMSRIAADISEYIVGEFGPFSLMMAVTMQVSFPEFIGHAASIVADAFGDEQNFDILQLQLRNMH